ncbi:MAG: hypothetical protein KGZ83_15865 [Sulfuricella sp.]|nr:hypothetical protein [Sulfuricella sp.]
MLIKLLSAADKEHLLELLELLALADKHLLWDGKRKEEITSETDLNKLSIQNGEQESALLADMKSEGAQSSSVRPQIAGVAVPIIAAALFSFTSGSVETSLIEKLKAFPLQEVEEPATRAQAAMTILKKLLEGKESEIPSVPKLMLFELMLMALCGGSIFSIEWALLKEFQHHHRLEDFIFDDLLECAETMNREVSKTIAIILE